jgi:hypothetical protein
MRVSAYAHIDFVTFVSTESLEADTVSWLLAIALLWVAGLCRDTGLAVSGSVLVARQTLSGPIVEAGVVAHVITVFLTTVDAAVRAVEAVVAGEREAESEGHVRAKLTPSDGPVQWRVIQSQLEIQLKVLDDRSH